MPREKLFGKTLHELQSITEQMGMPPFAAKQMADWLYKKQVSGIAAMTNISAAKREELQQRYEVGVEAPTETLTSSDSTKKYLFRIRDKGYIETVLIPDRERNTLCVSSQVGCKMNCLFCMTGKQGFSGNLTAGEILNQIRSIPETEEVTNIVFMGMGEPFDNTGEVLKALEILTSLYGYARSPRRITVSTIGITPAVTRFLEHAECHLAISLHAADEATRKKLMPVEKVYPFKKTVEVLRNYNFSGQRRLSFEYILFDGLNDSRQCALELAKQLRGLPCRVNLIKYHAIPCIELRGSPLPQMVEFRDTLNSKGIISTIRTSKGEDILAACGMLSTHNSSKREPVQKGD